MKKIALAIVAMTSTLSFVGCSEIMDKLQIENVKFETPVEDVDVPFAGIENMILPPIEVTLDVDVNEEVKKKTGKIISLDNIREAYLDAFRIELMSTDSENGLTVFKDAELWAKSPNFPETKIAYISGNTSAETMNFEVIPGVDLINFMKSEAGTQKVILKNIKVGNSAFTEFTIRLVPKWKVTIGV